MDWTPGDLGGGYAIFSELLAYTRAGSKWSTNRTMERRKEHEFPAPLSYTCATVTPTGGTSEIRITFEAPVSNTTEPVVGDAAARDELKGAWGQRFVLPADTRIDGEFQRKVDRDLAKLGWSGTVKGEFTLLGLEAVELILDEKLFRNAGWASRVADSCRGHFRWFYGFLEDRDFESEFASCGFRRAGNAIEVLGYAKAQAFRVEEGRIVAFRANDYGDGTWWEFKLKENKEDRWRIETMTASIDGRNLTLRHKYQRVKGSRCPSPSRRWECPNPPASSPASASPSTNSRSSKSPAPSPAKVPYGAVAKVGLLWQRPAARAWPGHHS
ncbi:MAG: hypothetical protein HC813_02080 [Planctomycetes bacterium]|nr:hypothetical protein [Planctomycetota bacterium]